MLLASYLAFFSRRKGWIGGRHGLEGKKPHVRDQLDPGTAIAGRDRRQALVAGSSRALNNLRRALIHKGCGLNGLQIPPRFQGIYSRGTGKPDGLALARANWPNAFFECAF